MSEEDSELERMFQQLFGEEGARSILESMRAQGIDPQELAASGILPSNPLQIQLAMGQIKAMMSGTDGPVNWSFAHQLAQSGIAKGDTVVTAAQQRRAEQRLQVADLWLDAVTDFVAVGTKRVAWSRADWIEQTLPAWKRITEPIAQNIARAFADIINQQLPDDVLRSTNNSEDNSGEANSVFGSMLQNPHALVKTMSSAIYGLQIGKALADVAGSALTSSDGALPLTSEPIAALVIPNLDYMAHDLELPESDVDMYVAVREVARARLFSSVPWLRAHLFGAIEEYAKHIQIDQIAIDTAMQSMQGISPAELENMEPIAMFETTPSAEQERAQDELETLIATIEGWVEVVTMRACLPHMATAPQMRELLRRRVITGTRADDVLASLVGLKLRPKRAHLAARLWEQVTAAQGNQGRDLLWRHPDIRPTSTELDNPDAFLDNRAKQADSEADVDAELNALLSGTLGWAEGLSPDQDSQGDALQK